MSEVFNLPTKEQFDTMNTNLTTIANNSTGGTAANVTIADVGDIITATNVEDALQEVETQIDDLATYGGCFARLSTNQSISTATETKISFNSVERESKYTFWSSSYPTRLTIPSGVSRVRLVAQAAWIDSEVGIRTIRIGKNDGNVNSPRPLALASAKNNPLTSGLSTPLQVFVNEIEVTEGDYFELLVYQNSGAALSVSSTGAVTYLTIEVIE
jgi:hypothetical protein